MNERIKRVLRAEGKIAAIKVYRELHPGMGLAEAKAYVERIETGADSSATNSALELDLQTSITPSPVPEFDEQSAELSPDEKIASSDGTIGGFFILALTLIPIILIGGCFTQCSYDVTIGDDLKRLPPGALPARPIPAFWEWWRRDPWSVMFFVFVGVLGIYVLGAALVIASRRFSRRAEKRGRLLANRNAQIESNTAEAAELTRKACSIIESALGAKRLLPHHLEAATKLGRKAEREFEERLYYPFWTTIDKAGDELNRFVDSVQAIADYKLAYHRLLEGRRHDFPKAFPVNEDALPSPVAVLEYFNAVVRRAHKERDFANIYGHWRTREGVDKLGEKIDNLHHGLVHALSELQSVLEGTGSGMLTALEEMRSDSAEHAVLASEQRAGLERRVIHFEEVIAEVASENQRSQQRETEILENIMHKRVPMGQPPRMLTTKPLRDDSAS